MMACRLYQILIQSAWVRLQIFVSTERIENINDSYWTLLADEVNYQASPSLSLVLSLSRCIFLVAFCFLFIYPPCFYVDVDSCFYKRFAYILSIRSDLTKLQ